MRTMTFCVGLAGLLMISGCQNPELLQCQEESAGLVTQAAELQKKLDKLNETSEKTFLLLMKESIKSKKEFDALAQENKAQREDFQKSLTESNGKYKIASAAMLAYKNSGERFRDEVEVCKEKLSASAKLLSEIRQQLGRLMQENTQLNEKIAQLRATSASDDGSN